MKWIKIRERAINEDMIYPSREEIKIFSLSKRIKNKKIVWLRKFLDITIVDYDELGSPLGVIYNYSS